MGYFSHIILALAAIVAADAGFETGWREPWALLLLLPLPYLLAGWIRNRSMLGKFRVVAVGTRCLTYSPILLQLIAVGIFGWVGSVANWIGQEASTTELPEFAILFSLAPFVVFELIAIDARSRLFALLAADIARLRNFQYRMLFSGLAPISIYMLLASTLSLSPTLRAYVEEIDLFHVSFVVLSLVVFALSLPAILRNTWETEPLTDGVAFRVLTDVAERARFECKRLLVWKTGHQVSNAAILGFSRRQRTVLFTDSLLAELSPRELAGVFAHEMGHARRNHVRIFAAWTIAFFLSASLLMSEFGSGEEWLWMLESGALVGAWYLGFGYLSRRFELDADLESLSITGDGEALLSALDSVGGSHARYRASWRHFSTAKRVLFLSAVMRHPHVGRRLRKTLSLWKRLGYALFFVAVSVQLASMSRTWNDGWIDANLRLGQYIGALEHVDDQATDDSLAELVRLAAEASDADGTISPTELSAHALGALRRADAAEALIWLELSARRALSPHSSIYQRLRDDFELAETDEQAQAAMHQAASELAANRELSKRS